MPIQSYFPTLVYTAKLPTRADLHQKLLKEAYVFKELDLGGQKWSKQNYAGGYTSYSSMDNLMLRSPYFGELEQKLNKHVSQYAKTLELDPKRHLKMNSLWVNIMGELSHHSFHLHPLSVISGTYYLKTPKGSGDFKIEDPRIQCFMGSPRRATTSRKNARYIKLQPQAGDIILFESWLKHEVTANLSGSDRVSVSFNYSAE